VTALRSVLFNIVFYVNLALFLVLGAEFFLLPRKWAIRALQAWAKTSLVLLRLIAGIHMEVRGREHIPKGAALVAGKHQSFWETFAILPLLDDPAMVLKKELIWIPFFGWFIFKFRMIAVERSAGTAALRSLWRGGKRKSPPAARSSSCRKGRGAAPMTRRITSRAPRRSMASSGSPARPSLSIPASVGRGGNSSAIPAPSSLNSCRPSRPAWRGANSRRGSKPPSRAPRRGWSPRGGKVRNENIFSTRKDFRGTVVFS
jgi:hypothetical protein